MTKLTIASRESRLAMWQAEHVQSLLNARLGASSVSILGMTTEGDRVLDKALNLIGGKGLFIKELEVALLEGKADFAVHSLKDVPMDLPPEFSLVAVMRREDPRDAFVSNKYDSLEALPQGAVLGTSSLRRAAQLKAKFPHLKIEPLRGNVNTRLAKLDQGQFDAIVLAAAGLKRLGFVQRIRQIIPPSLCLPAAGQGALGLEVLASRSAEMADHLGFLGDHNTLLEVSAERAVSRALGGSCRVPLAAFCETQADGQLYLRACVASEDGSKVVSANATLPASSQAQAEKLGDVVSQDLIKQGARDLL